MRAPVVIQLDPVGDDPHRMLLDLEAVMILTLLLQGLDNVLDHAVRLRTVPRDELLFQLIAPDQAGVITTGVDQPIIGSQ